MRGRGRPRDSRSGDRRYGILKPFPDHSYHRRPEGRLFHLNPTHSTRFLPSPERGHPCSGLLTGDKNRKHRITNSAIGRRAVPVCIGDRRKNFVNCSRRDIDDGRSRAIGLPDSSSSSGEPVCAGRCNWIVISGSTTTALMGNIDQLVVAGSGDRHRSPADSSTPRKGIRGGAKRPYGPSPPEAPEQSDVETT